MIILAKTKQRIYMFRQMNKTLKKKKKKKKVNHRKKKKNLLLAQYSMNKIMNLKKQKLFMRKKKKKNNNKNSNNLFQKIKMKNKLKKIFIFAKMCLHQRLKVINCIKNLQKHKIKLKMKYLLTQKQLMIQQLIMLQIIFIKQKLQSKIKQIALNPFYLWKMIIRFNKRIVIQISLNKIIQAIAKCKMKQQLLFSIR